MQASQLLQELLTGALAAVGYDLWGTEMIQSGTKATLRVYIDKQGGVNIDDCEKASHQISAVLEAESAELANYILEVSSPGLYRPLFTLPQYQQFIGKPIKLKLKHANELNRKNFSGVLVKADEENIAVEVDGEEFFFELPEIAGAHLNPDIFKSKSKTR